MGKRKKIKVSYTKKLAWLRKRHIIVKKGKVAKSTVDRQYSYFHRHPLTTPRNVAYGYKSRIEAKIEKYGEKATIRTPRGKITAKQYVKASVEKIDNGIRRRLPFRTEYYPNIYYKNVEKVQDHIEHRFNPNEYLAVKYKSGRNNLIKIMNRVQKYLTPMIKDDIRLVNNLKGKYYRTFWVNIRVHFIMEDINGIITDHYKHVPFSEIRNLPLEEFLKFYFHSMTDNFEDVMLEGFRLCLTPSGGAGSTLSSIKVYFSTDRRASEYDKLRVQRSRRTKKKP